MERDAKQSKPPGKGVIAAAGQEAKQKVPDPRLREALKRLPAEAARVKAGMEKIEKVEKAAAAAAERKRLENAARAAAEEAARIQAEAAAAEEAARIQAEAAAAAAAAAKAQIPIEQQENQWKRLGIYLRRNFPPEIPGGEFLVYVWNPDEKGTYLYKGNPVDARARTDDIVDFNGYEYVRLRSFAHLSYDQELKGATQVAKGAGSTQRSSVLLGKNLVFKTASVNNLSACLQEVSRSLRVISAGFPHATVFGIIEREGQFNIVEEKLDIGTSSQFFNQLHQTFEKMFNGFPIQPNEQIRLANYLLMFAKFTKLLREFKIGGDFKLNNLSFRRGNPEIFFATDLVMGMPTNPFIPMTYAHWAQYAAGEEGGEALFIDPFFRLRYYAPQYGGVKRRVHQTRRHRQKKNKTRRSKI